MTGVLSYADRKGINCPQAHYGKASRYHEGDYWLESGPKIPARTSASRAT